MFNIPLRIIPITLLLVFVQCVVIAQGTVYTLEQCIQIAFENNLNVQRGKLDQKSSEINLVQSRMSRLPDLNLGSSYGSNWGRSIDPTSNLFETRKINSAGLSGQSNVTLYSGFQISNTIKQSIIELEAGTKDLEKVKNDVALSVANLYLNVIFNQELKGNAELQLNSSNEQVDRTQKLVDAGSLPITNLLNLQAQRATDEVNLVNAENNYDLAVLQLKQALLIPANDPFEIEVPDIQVESLEPTTYDPNEIFSQAQGNQPEIKSADLRIRSADVGMKISKSAYMPRLTFSGGFRTNYSGAANQPRPYYDGTTIVNTPIGFLESDPNELVLAPIEFLNEVSVDPDFTLMEQFDENLSRYLSLNLSIPVFNKWRTKSDVQRSIITRQRAELNAAEVRNTLRQNIETAFNNFIAASKSYNASERQVNALEESFRVIENQYNLGGVNFVDYQVAANNLYMARSDKLRAKYDYIFKAKVLDFYLGKPLTF